MRNVKIAYILALSKNTWFWLGIWVFYYLRFTNYAGIGLIETILITTMTLFEIPTGAIADLLGKKKTLILCFLFESVGAFMMAMAMDFQFLALSVFILGIGGTLYSGTLDALVYDSLKEKGKEDVYAKKISNINTISLVSPAVCGALGGFMYSVDPRLPFYASAFGYCLGLIASVLLTEPLVDTVKFSFKNFLAQTKQGLRELTKSSYITRQTIILLSIGVVVVISDEMLGSFLGVEFGFNDKELGILWSIIFVLAALASQLTPSIRKRFKGNVSVIIVGAFIAITFLLSPILGLILGGLSLTLRSSLQSIFNNLASITINENTESRFRATTLSTFNMIKNIPYVLSAYFIGSISDSLSAKTTSFILGVLLACFIGVQILNSKNKSAEEDKVEIEVD